MDMPSTSPKVSMDDAYKVLPVDHCEFELTVVGVTGLGGTSVWSQSQGGYVTVAIGGKLIHKTNVVGSGREPEWKETFQFIANRAHNLTISIYASVWDRDVLVGQIEERLINVDRAGKDVNRTVSSMHSTRPLTLNFRFEPRRRMFGFIVGIDEYKSEDIPDLHGCKRDAQSMVDLLSHKFHVPSSHFLCLANEKATRHAFISGFQKHLIENNNIERGDAIVIFYAGHGSRVRAPEGWVADDNHVETICPHDERTIGHDGKEVFSIPDRTFGGLLRKLSSIKGDNITVICDSCHSSGNTRAGRVARRVAGTTRLPENTDKAIWTWGLSGSKVPTGFLDNTMSSHVHLAACRHDELAFEDPSAENMVRGAFTRDLVKILYQAKDLTKVTYSALLHLLPPLEHQHPQCSGKNKGRVLFQGLTGTHPTTFRLLLHGGRYFAEAGDVHGVVKGTLFAIHPCRNITPIDSEIGILEADVVFAHSCTLARRRGDKAFQIPSGARASVLNWRHREPVLKVFIPHPRIAVQTTNAFYLVNSPDKADLVIRSTSHRTLQLERLDPVVSKYARVLHNIRPQSSLSDMLQGFSHFHFHLYRRNSANPLKQEVEVVLHRLTQSNPEQILEEAIYIPNGAAGIRLSLDRENTVIVPTGATSSRRVFYGLTMKNNSGRKLFPYLMCFDPSNYSIQSWYHPPAETMEAPLPPRHNNRRGELKVGYGVAGVDAFEFSLADGVSADVTFLKLFVSTVYIDMMVLEQSSPFFTVRGGHKVKVPPADIWDAWTYVVKTKRQITRGW